MRTEVGKYQPKARPVSQTAQNRNMLVKTSHGSLPDCPQSWNHLAHGTSERDVLLRRPVRIRAWHPLPDTLQNQEKEIIEAALAESRGKVAGPEGAAAKLGIPRSTLDSKIKQLNIKKHKFIAEQ